jgi:hypothetical protein
VIDREIVGRALEENLEAASDEENPSSAKKPRM